MSDLDVSLRLRLLNQLSRPAEEAERDLKDLQKAAEQLGRTKGAAGLVGDLDRLGREAGEAKTKLGEIGREAVQVRNAIGRVGDGAFSGIKADAVNAGNALAKVKGDADSARLAIARIGDGFGNLKAEAMNAKAGLAGIGQQADATKAAIGRVGSGAFETLKSDAASAEAAVRGIGAAADAAEAKLRGLRVPNTGGALPGTHGQAGTPNRSTGGVMSTVEGAVDQFGVPLAIGAGGAYLAGAGPAGLAVAGGAAVNAASHDEFTMDQLQATGGFNDAEQKRYQEMLGRSGARRGIGTQGAMGVFGALQAGGLSSDDAARMADDVTVFAKATQSEPEDAANTAVALRNNMGIPADKMMRAYDAMAVGGKEGQFEVKDMSRQFPSMLAAMSAQGSKGFEGVNLATAMAQSIRRTTGSGDQAKTRFEALLSDLTAPEVVDRAKKMGFDPNKAKQNALKNGDDPVLAMLEGYRKVVGGNEPRFKELFRNSGTYAGLAAVFKDLEEMKGMIGRMEKAEGTVSKDYETSTSNFQSQKDRLASNVGKNIKDEAAPLLPVLTKIMTFVSERLEGARDRETREEVMIRKHFGDQKLAYAYQQYGKDRQEGERGGPSGWERFLWGDAAYDGFSFRDHVRETLGQGPKKLDPAISAPEEIARSGGRPSRRPSAGDLGESSGKIPLPLARPVDLGKAASASMGAYNEALAAEGEEAKSTAQSIAESIKAMLGFTVSPTISPTYIPASGTGSGGGKAGGEKHGAVQQPAGGGTKVTQNIYSPNAKHAALRSIREQNRAIRQAQARSYAGTGRSLA